MIANRHSIAHRLLFWLSGQLKIRIIDGPKGEPYLERYEIVSIGRFKLYLHRFLADDPDRGLHNHPWAWAFSIVLVEGYQEIRLKDPTNMNSDEYVRDIHAGRLNFIRGGDFHRILLRGNRQAWTLFFHGKRTEGWGFVRDGQFIPHDASEDDHRARNWSNEAPRGKHAARQPL